MIFKKSGFEIGIILVLCIWGGVSWASGDSKELRPRSQMNGMVTAPVEEGLQALSSGDKILVTLEDVRPVKKGDRLEIFQPVVIAGKSLPDGLLARIGQAVVLEVVEERLLLCMIVSSIREVGVRDRIFWPE
jgi:hypothetical protein